MPRIVLAHSKNYVSLWYNVNNKKYNNDKRDRKQKDPWYLRIRTEQQICVGKDRVSQVCKVRLTSKTRQSFGLHGNKHKRESIFDDTIDNIAT